MVICDEPDCKKQAFYGFEWGVPVCCANHRKEEMVNVKNKRCLECDKIPVFNIPGEKQALYCAEHKKEGMVDVKHIRCKNDWCYTKVSNPSYEGYCAFCFVNMFPDRPNSRNYKTKEFAVVDHVKSQFPHVDWVADKRVSGGCSRRRPDLLLDLGYQVVIVEIDENQHTDYDCTCENRRLMELSQDVGHRPLIFIRFNPDEYEINGKEVKTCWGVNRQTGLSAIKKTKQAEWNARLEALTNQIHYWSAPENKTDKTIEVVQLFYDE